MDKASKILSDVTVFSRYAKFDEKLGRRENWVELVDRNKEMHIAKFPDLKDQIEEAYRFVYDKKVLPSMRSMQFGGKAIEVNNSRIYNCSFQHIDSVHSFSETMFLLLAGCGVGYSVQKKHIEKLPPITKPSKGEKKFLVGDSIEGWADAVKVLLKSYMQPNSPKVRFDYSSIRSKGTPIKTGGGKAPGPEPLKRALDNVRGILDSVENGEQLRSVQIHDILCHLADAVLAGGIRRSAMISLFDIDDDAMLTCKSNFKIVSYEPVVLTKRDQYGNEVKLEVRTVDEATNTTYKRLKIVYSDPAYGVRTVEADVGEHDIPFFLDSGIVPWFYVQEQRGRANNSVVLVRHKMRKKADFERILKITEESKAGEPGIFWTNNPDWGTNPCGEIGLRTNQFCNLCEINASDITDQADYEARVKAAAFIGTLQASYTDFHYLRDVWRKTTEKEALLGIGMTGIASGKVLQLDMAAAAEVATKENERMAKVLGINKAARVTTVKPSGTTSCVLGSSSGIHAWHNDFYLRRMRLLKTEAMYGYLKMFHPELLEDDAFNKNNGILTLPQKAPEGAITRKETAIQQLERMKKVYLDWVQGGHKRGDNTHNVSITVSVRDGEWTEVTEWMWKNKDSYAAISLLPLSNHTYHQAPFEDIGEAEYKQRMEKLVDVDIDMIREDQDYTNLSGEAACVGGACIVT
jgi:hypothetical protein